MKCALSVLGLVIAAAIAAPAQAQNYPWCEYLGGGLGGGGGRNCGFISFEQCMESARGNGSDCRPNTMYTPPPGAGGEVGYGPRAGYYPGNYYRHARKKSHGNS